jgi:hypothetical protein
MGSSFFVLRWCSIIRVEPSLGDFGHAGNGGFRHQRWSQAAAKWIVGPRPMGVRSNRSTPIGVCASLIVRVADDGGHHCPGDGTRQNACVRSYRGDDGRSRGTGDAAVDGGTSSGEQTASAGCNVRRSGRFLGIL